MMNFVIMTLSFTTAILLASAISVMVVTNKRVLKWYLKKVQKSTEEFLEEDLDEYLDALKK